MTQSATAAVRPGELLAGKYRVERVLGVGGMGIVVAARHEKLDQLVAIKFVRDEVLGTSDAVERFLREARAAVKLRSEHVAKVLDVGTLESGAPYMVMELLEGSDLGQVLTRDGPQPVELAALLMIQACEAVAEAHSLGIVHRDLKPQNLFLTRSVTGAPKLKVLDFGVSKAIGLGSGGAAGHGALTSTRAMLGSPLYMAPEQMRSSRDVDGRADIWALGVVLFELLTQRWPFESDSLPNLCLKVVGEPPISVLSLRPDIPPGLAAIIDRCLAKEAAARFASATDLAMALEPFAPPHTRFFFNRSHPDISGALSGSGPGPLTPQPITSAPITSRFITPSQLSTPRKHSAVAPTVAPPAAAGEALVATRGSSAPSAWGDSKSGTMASRTNRGRTLAWMAIAGGVVLLALVTLTASFRFGRPKSGAADSTPPTAASPPAQAAVASASPPTPATVVTLTPPAPAASASASSATVTPPPVQWRRPAPVGAPKPSARTAPSPRGPDDDIPALR